MDKKEKPDTKPETPEDVDDLLDDELIELTDEEQAEIEANAAEVLRGYTAKMPPLDMEGDDAATRD